MATFDPGQPVMVNGKYVGEFVRETEHRIAIVMGGVVHVFIKQGEVVAV